MLYVLAEADWDANRTISHIWRVNRDGGGSVQLTNGEKGETSPRWSPDGETVVFLATRGDADATQIYVLPNLGGEAHQLTDHPTAVSSITWSPDGRTIYFLASDEKTAEQQARDTAKDDVYAFEEAFQQRPLWTVAVSNGTTERVPRVTTRFSASTCHATDGGSRYSVGRTRCSSIGTRARSG